MGKKTDRQDGLVEYGFDDAEKCNRDPSERRAGWQKPQRDDGYRHGQVDRHLTDDPEDFVPGWA